MTIKDAINRTNNLLAVTVIALAGFAFLPEVFVEDEITHKIDDLGLFVLGLVAIVWYRLKKNRFSRSLTPVVLIYIGLVIKIVGVVVEIKDKEDIGDDFGGLILFVFAAFIVTWLYIKTKKILADNR